MRNTLRLHKLSPFFTLAIAEVLILSASLYMGLFLRWASLDNFWVTLVRYSTEASVYSGVFITANFCLGLYQWDCISTISETTRRLVFSFLIAFLLLAMVFYLFPGIIIWRSAMAIALPLSFLGLLSVRYLFLHLTDSAFLRHRVAVIGVGDQAARIEAFEHAGRSKRFTCAAFIDVAGEPPRVARERVVAHVNSLPDFIQERAIDEIVVATENRRGCLPLQSLIDCRLTGTTITSYQTFCERETGRIDLDALRPEWFLFSQGFTGGRIQRTVKRLLDIAASIVLLILCLPLLISTALAIRIESQGPVFYRQQRLGFKGTPFMLTKFRSMRTDAERDGVPKWAAENDPRVTTVGAFIRKTRIDEIPQLFNVLKGDMSFVGPRPERPFFVDQLRQCVQYYDERHRVKPGITGWAQVNYPYGASVVDAKRKLEYDLYYIKYQSLFRDILIIMQTVKVILVPKGVR